jgi:glycosyltransferase involved in cell wall biosynthesis
MVPPRDAAALAEALEEIIVDPALRARLAEGGRKLYEHQFEAGAYLKRLAAIYSAAERSSGMLPESCPHRRTS